MQHKCLLRKEHKYMTTDRGVSTLPKENRDALATAYADYQDSLRSSDAVRTRKAQRIARLFLSARNAGWPNGAIGDACGITGTSAARIIARYGKDEDGKPLVPARAPKFPVYAGAKGSAARPTGSGKRDVRVLTDEEKQRLAELAALARTCTGSRALNHPSRIASVEFSKKIMEYHDAGVTWKIIADASGMQISGVRMRATRHGYNSGPPPSIAPYQNVVRKPQRNSDAKEEAAPAAKAAPRKKAAARKVGKKVAVKATTSRAKTSKVKSA